jgi:hypothetical protein
MTVNGVPHERQEDLAAVGLPLTPFLYHFDQVATMLGKTESQLIDTHIFYLGRSVGRQHPRKIKAVNIAADPDAVPEWRITEGELVRWLKLIGIKLYSRGRAV